MDQRVPPSREVQKEQFVRSVTSVADGLVAIHAALARAGSAALQFGLAMQRSEMRHHAVTMQEDPREMDNRLVDWLRQP